MERDQHRRTSNRQRSARQAPPASEATTPVQRRTPERRRRRWHWLLLAIPFAWCIVAVPWAGTVGVIDGGPFGRVPFLLVWMVLGVVVGSVAIGVTYAIDSARGDVDR